MAECVKRDDVRQMLHGIGGCGSDPDTWADGWDKAIDTAIGELDKLPVVELVEDSRVYLKPRPFCGERASVFVDGSVRVICNKCNASTAAMGDVMGVNGPVGCAKKKVIEYWNRRYNERKEAEIEVEENG